MKGLDIQRVSKPKVVGDKGSALVIGCFLAVTLFIVSSVAGENVHAGDQKVQFKRIPTQFIAALGDPSANSGTRAQTWGLWRRDPGPRGVWLKNYDELVAAGGVAPANWRFDRGDWWVEENGLIMEKPEFPVPVGRYIVTGDREVMSMLTIHPANESGDQRWELDSGAQLYDVTHLPCRSARYTPKSNDNFCSPARAQTSEFPVTPGALMPPVEGCNKQDYAVLFVVAVEMDN